MYNTMYKLGSGFRDGPPVVLGREKREKREKGEGGGRKKRGKKKTVESL